MRQGTGHAQDYGFAKCCESRCRRIRKDAAASRQRPAEYGTLGSSHTRFDRVCEECFESGIPHIKLPGSERLTILDESHCSVTYECREPSHQAHETFRQMGGRLVRHARRLVFQFRLRRESSMKSGLAEVAVSREVFRSFSGRIGAPPRNRGPVPG